MKNLSLLKMNIRSWIRRDRGSALISAMLIGTISSIWLAAIYGSIITVFQTHTSARLKNTLRNGAETALEWGITQMNANAATGGTPAIDAGEGTYKKTAVPSNTMAEVAPGIVINARVYVDNIPAPGPDIASPPASPAGYSYLYDPHLVTGAAGIDRNHWRVLTAVSELGAMPNKRAGVRVILKPIFTVSQQMAPSVPSTTSSPSHMLTANSIAFGGAGHITGDVHSNGDLNLTGSNTVNGSVTTTGKLNITGSSTINGLIASLGDVKIQSNVNGPISTLGGLTTSGSSSVKGNINAKKDVNLSASMNVNGNLFTNGTLTTSGSFTMSNGNIMSTGSQSASGSFGLTGGNLITLGNFNLAWGSINATNSSNGKAYHGGSNLSPAWSPGANMSTGTPQTAFGGLKATDAVYVEANNQLQDALAAAAEQAKAVPMPPAPDRPAGAQQLAANALTKSGSNNVTLNAGDYYINGPIDFSGSNNLQVNGKVRIWLEGSNAYIKFSGANNINRNDTDPKNQLEVYTNSSKPIQFSGATNVAIGYIYAPNAAVTMSGANVAGVGGIVANNISFTGASGLARNGSVNPWDVTTTTTTDAPVYAYTFQNSWQVVSWQELSAAEIAAYANRN